VRQRDLAAAGGLAAAYAAFAMAFRGPRDRFWSRMTATGLVLGSLALFADARLRHLRPRPRDVGLGLASAAGLYVIFLIGDRTARRVMPRGGEEIDAVYALRSARSKGELAARLGLVIAPAEELFWRGLLQSALAERLGRWPGAAAAASLYGAAHASTGNLMLTGAATTAGAYWGALRAAGIPLPVLVVSHVAWDVWIFLVAPTAPQPAGRGRAHPPRAG
jgi:uncharacterized protein